MSRDLALHRADEFQSRFGRGVVRWRLRLSTPLLAIGAAFLLTCAPAAARNCKSDPDPGINWQECNKSSLLLQGSELSGANLFEVDFSSTDLRNSDLRSANLEKATLVRASLAGAQADGANFARVEGYRTSLAGISAQGASFAGAELQRADFSGANLTGADFEKAELGRANFAEAVLTGTRFSLANLARADLTGALFKGPIDFRNAFLYLTRVEGLDLTQATGLVQWQVNLACGDAKTMLPAGLKPSPDWPCTFD